MAKAHPEPVKTLSGSAFHMWRCIVAVAQADGQVSDAELSCLSRIFADLQKADAVSKDQMAVFGEDLVPPGPDIARLLPQVTDPGDRRLVFYFGGLMAQADGEMDPREDAILKKIGAAGKLSEKQIADYLAEAQEYCAEQSFLASLRASEIREKSGFRAVVNRLLQRLALLPPDAPQ